MNYYSEDIEHIDIDGTIAVIYTPNDYSDLMRMCILPGDKEFDQRFEPTPESPLYTDGGMAFYSQVLFRNFNLKSALDADRLGMNIVSHLIVRFDDQLRMTP